MFNAFRDEIFDHYIGGAKNGGNATNAASPPQHTGLESIDDRLTDQVVNILARMDCQSVRTAANLVAPADQATK